MHLELATVGGWLCAPQLADVSENHKVEERGFPGFCVCGLDSSFVAEESSCRE